MFLLWKRLFRALVLGLGRRKEITMRKASTTLVAGLMAGALVLGAAGAARAFYQPGVLRGAASGSSGSRDAFLVPAPSQQGVPGGFWKVEENILLQHFEHGTGRPVLVIHGGPGIPPHMPWKGLERLDGEYRFFYYHQRGCGRSTRPSIVSIHPIFSPTCRPSRALLE
jgi:hypothetical protein